MRAVLFDLGDTLIHEQVDDRVTLDQLALELQPAAAPTLRLLSREYALGIVSDTETSPEPAVRRALQQLGIDQYFAAVVTSVDTGVRKPDPAIFRTALDRLRVAPSETVMVGNDPSRDIPGARALGMRTVLYRSSRYYRPDAAAEADYVIDSLGELPAILKRLRT